MKCQDLLAQLNDFVDGPVDPSVCEEFERHMAGCNPCQVVVDNIRRTITVYRAGEPYELPLAFKARLHAALRERWERAGRPTSDSAQPEAPAVSPGVLGGNSTQG